MQELEAKKMKYKKNYRGIVTTLPKVSLDSVQYKTLKNQPEFFYGIRPEEVKLVTKNENSMKVKIKDISFKGSTSTINATNENNDVILKIQNISSNISQTLSVGTYVDVEFNTELGSIFTE